MTSCGGLAVRKLSCLEGKEEVAYRQTRAELEEHLRQQMNFLRTSSQAFDAGTASEAVRIATSLRVLLHDTNSSHSLLGQLGIKEAMQFVDTGLDQIPGNLLSNDGLTIIRTQATSTTFAAPLGELSPRRQSKPRKTFDDWWLADVIDDQLGNRFTRRDLVLALANKEGGAHVDPELEEAYAALSRSGSLGWIVQNDTGARPLVESPVPASVRQIAYEVERTLESQIPETNPS